MKCWNPLVIVWWWFKKYLHSDADDCLFSWIKFRIGLQKTSWPSCLFSICKKCHWWWKTVFQNATVIVKYSWGVFRALSQMIALSYGSMDAPTSKNYRFSLSPTKKSTGVSHSLSDISACHFTVNEPVCRCLLFQIMLKCGSSWSAWCPDVWCTLSWWQTLQPW